MLSLKRLKEVPVLEPTDNWWENKAVFNPGATIFENQILLLYRALGGDNISRFGLARSSDGVNFQRFPEPVFEGDQNNPLERLGVEDPRISKFGDEYYILYTGTSAYKKSEKEKLTWQRKAPWRVRTFLIKTRDFKTFTHEELVFEQDCKDLVLFSEKIDDKFAMLVRIYPDIFLTYSTNLKAWEPPQKIVSTREGLWDSERIGSGPTPFKTEIGWLHFYHGVDRENKYHVGILVHDLNNLKNIIYRSKVPVLSPETTWEKEGEFPNVVFSCGAVEKNGSYLIYYGAADKVVGVASIEKNELINEIKKETSL